MKLKDVYRRFNLLSGKPLFRNAKPFITKTIRFNCLANTKYVEDYHENPAQDQLSIVNVFRSK